MASRILIVEDDADIREDLARPRALGGVAATSEATRGYALGSVWLPRSAGYHVVLEPDPGGGYVAVVPAFPGCYSQGETEKEALENVREAILLTIRRHA